MGSLMSSVFLGESVLNQANEIRFILIRFDTVTKVAAISKYKRQF